MLEGVHALAVFGVSFGGVNAAQFIIGFYTELGQRLAKVIPYEKLPDRPATLTHGESIKNRAASFKRGGANGKQMIVHIRREDMGSPLKYLESIGKIVVKAPVMRGQEPHGPTPGTGDILPQP